MAMMRGYGMRAFIRGEEAKPTQPAWKIFRRFAKYAWDQRRLLALAAVAVILVSLLNLVVPQLTGYTIDEVIPQQQHGRIWLVVLAILGAGAAMGVLSALQSYTMSVVGQRVIYALRNQIYSHLQTLSMRFFDDRRTGELMSRVTNDVNALQHLITSGLLEIVTDSVTFVVILTILILYDWQLTLLLSFTIPLMVVTTRYFGRRIRSAFRTVQEQMAQVNAHLQETISGIRLVQSFANEKYEVERFNESNRRSMEAHINAVKLNATFLPLIDIINRLGYVVVLGFGARQVIVGRLSVGQLVQFMLYLQLLYQPVRRFSRLMNTIQQAAASGERIFEILDTKPEVTEKPDAIALTRCEGRIRFENVSFGYKKGEYVLHDFTLDVEPGQTVALVGPSGAGKTTVTNLLMRFYDPDEGRIMIDGYDLRDLTLESLRRQFGIVSQEIVLLHGTVRENIAYGNPGATEEEIIEAAKIANAHGFIRDLPDGYDTVIGERGMKLSGGQRQRLAIARAVLKNPRILILDEATSQLDSESEHLIQQALERLLKGRTSVVIAHRLSTIRNADLIVVMDRGRIVDMGQHEELLARGGLYATLYSRQFARDGAATA